MLYMVILLDGGSANGGDRDFGQGDFAKVDDSCGHDDAGHDAAADDDYDAGDVDYYDNANDGDDFAHHGATTPIPTGTPPTFTGSNGLTQVSLGKLSVMIAVARCTSGAQMPCTQNDVPARGTL